MDAGLEAALARQELIAAPLLFAGGGTSRRSLTRLGREELREQFCAVLPRPYLSCRAATGTDLPAVARGLDDRKIEARTGSIADLYPSAYCRRRFHRLTLSSRSPREVEDHGPISVVQVPLLDPDNGAPVQLREVVTKRRDEVGTGASHLSASHPCVRLYGMVIHSPDTATRGAGA
ncbi:hypothetical protein [Streptomyces sp.]|uniref:hypothetical protein n=1 Tax=Streptomyces sp. TaxID=1931 RepID=UPI002F95B571